MRKFTDREARILSVTYAVAGALLLWGILFTSSGCTYVDVVTENVTIKVTGELGK